jgi:predicted Zn-dependent protease
VDLQDTLMRVQHLARLQKFKQARQEIREALANFPGQKNLLAILCDIYLAEENFPAARQSGTELLAMHPDFCRTFYVQAKLAIQANEYVAAESQIRKALSLSPEVAGYLARLAQIKHLQREDEMGVTDF